MIIAVLSQFVLPATSYGQTNETEPNNSGENPGIITITESGDITGTVVTCGRGSPESCFNDPYSFL